MNYYKVHNIIFLNNIIRKKRKRKEKKFYFRPANFTFAPLISPAQWLLRYSVLVDVGPPAVSVYLWWPGDSSERVKQPGRRRLTRVVLVSTFMFLTSLINWLRIFLFVADTCIAGEQEEWTATIAADSLFLYGNAFLCYQFISHKCFLRYQLVIAWLPAWVVADLCCLCFVDTYNWGCSWHWDTAQVSTYPSLPD